MPDRHIETLNPTEAVMQMQAVKSSTIEVVGYDKDSRKMRVAFKDRPVQEFCHVPEQLFSEFLKARSKNRFYKRHLQNLFPC